jgi:hypothetical protein
MSVDSEPPERAARRANLKGSTSQGAATAAALSHTPPVRQPGCRWGPPTVTGHS